MNVEVVVIQTESDLKAAQALVGKLGRSRRPAGAKKD
jgi:hypothetical protein